MSTEHDFLDNLANHQHQKMLREIANDDLTPKKHDFVKQNDIHEKIRNDEDYDDWDYGIQKGTYICTIDNYHQDPEVVDYATSENPAEHKSHNLIELENGQYALYPNNRMRIYDNSLTPVEPKMPDFKVSTQYYQVENGFERLGMGREDEYFWKTAKERENSHKDIIG